jgi:hypothetical protein
MQKISTESKFIAVTKPDHVVIKPFELVCGRNLEEFGEADYRKARML